MPVFPQSKSGCKPWSGQVKRGTCVSFPPAFSHLDRGVSPCPRQSQTGWLFAVGFDPFAIGSWPRSRGCRRFFARTKLPPGCGGFISASRRRRRRCGSGNIRVRPAELAALPPCKQLPFPASGIQFKAVARGSAVELPLAEGERIYGLGMNLKTFQLTGSKRTVRISDDQTGILGDSHGAAPFYVSTPRLRRLRRYGPLRELLFRQRLSGARCVGRVEARRRRTAWTWARTDCTGRRRWARGWWASTCRGRGAWTCTSSPVPTCATPCSVTTCFPAAAACRRCGAWACGIAPRPSWTRRRS